MKSYLDCVPCFIRQALDAVRMATDDPASHEQIVRDVLRLASGMDLSESPPVMGQRIHRRLRELTEGGDPYALVKARFNRLALEMLPELTARVSLADDPLEMAVRLAIAGNVIDMGVKSGITEDEVRHGVSQALREPLYGDLDAFRRAVESAEHILYLADNAGEIVFDRLLVTQLGPERVTVAVRGTAVINDATIEDARAAGLDGLVEVIDNGSDAPGTIVSDCSKTFQERFYAADLIIAKGQGNFETLSDESGNIYFLFKAKCPVIAAHVGLPVGAHALITNSQVASQQAVKSKE
jgi:damage-control phosphatase, subfamily I